jgi:hypothetical protein
MKMGNEKYIQNLSLKTSRKRSFEKPRCKWKDNIKMELGEIGR